MQKCPICGSRPHVNKFTCGGCGVEFTGNFHFPRLARLGAAHQRLAEQFLLSGGNFKELGQLQGITYPTLRKQIDSLIDELRALRAQDDLTISGILAQVESGALSAEAAERLIKELNGDA